MYLGNYIERVIVIQLYCAYSQCSQFSIDVSHYSSFSPTEWFLRKKSKKSTSLTLDKLQRLKLQRNTSSSTITKCCFILAMLRAFYAIISTISSIQKKNTSHAYRCSRFFVYDVFFVPVLGCKLSYTSIKCMFLRYSRRLVVTTILPPVTGLSSISILSQCILGQVLS